MDSLSLQLNLGLLLAPARKDFEYWRAIIGPLLTLPKVPTSHLEAVAEDHGIPFGTIKTKYYAARNKGLGALINRSLAGPKWWNARKGLIKISDSDKELVKKYCENNNRSSRQACKDLLADWQCGKIKTRTPIDPETGFPVGWSLRNLDRFKPTKHQLKAARIGTAAASSHRRLVYTTRKSLYVGSHYMLDDMWHNFNVNTFAERQSGRPLELFSHDLYSARKVRWGIRVRTKRQDGKANHLTESMTRMILAATLFLDGYSPRGTVLVAEHGTAAIREKIEQDLHDLSNGLLTISRSGMQGAKAHAGQYGGIVRGNPRHKASLESSNNRVQNAFAALPGQTGKDYQHQPEQLPALLRHNDQLLEASALLSPESAALLQYPLLELNQFLGVAHELYRRIECDPVHNLEGWVECGHVVQELLLGGQWIDQRNILSDPAQSQLALALISAGQLQSRPRRMSRREVWDMGCKELVRLPGFGVCAILGDDLSRERKTRSGMFEFEDHEVGPGTHRYSAIATGPQGERIVLADRERYETFVNPFAPDTLFVRSASGSYIGECERIAAPCRTDTEGLLRMVGAAAKAEAEALEDLRKRHAPEARAKAAMHRHNADVLAGRPVTPEQRDAARRERDAIDAVTDSDREALFACDSPHDPSDASDPSDLSSIL